jgi:hypothetical protein
LRQSNATSLKKANNSLLELLGELRIALRRLGLEVFLAHKDISPSVQWRQTIRENLDHCDVFVPVLTKHFHKSSWTDQESGFALAKNKIIVPVAVGILPYGFLNDFQAIKGNSLEPKAIARKLFVGLTKQASLRNRLRECLIPTLLKSKHYDDSGDIAELLLTLHPFSRRQVTLILKAAIANQQVHEARSAIEPIDKLIKRNRTRVESPLLNRFQRLSG